MAEIIQRDGVWAFDGSTVRITPGLHRSVALFRQTYGEIAVPLEAVAGVVYEPERKRGRLRLRLREGSDPLLQATGGRLPDAADPYRLTVDVDRSGIAEYVAEEIRQSMLLDQTPKEPARVYLLPGPPVPVSVRSSDGTVSFDGARVRIDWNDTSDRVKRATGPRIIDVGELVQVEWLPNSGYEDGFLRFVTRETMFSKLPPERDPFALDLWGSTRRDLLTALVATAVTARLPHPSTRVNGHADRSGPEAVGVTAEPPASDHHDTLLRRLRELGELHRDGVLTDEEFAATKAAVLRDF
ncbi:MULTISPECIES: DUF4429 domain-containing protein [Streptomyces]|uniref:DUF4429 domain-containing protein n=1 Tax=Streptomyces caniscabiei TaxID=2746961 RepID=A0ABU4MKT2_9ACTN|nr:MULTISPECIES: DUF4429 domain-containing protein [Streptomyces]MBE4737111.1 DUF4429 domain-containing protein [Streptomyces caniscabiei]MBE4757653.1 DUF4429 domain-containing protein [Streptomyces caniscabiei]MBE4770955.1 DUF4429 domain-containing protein [Streptomyces caniscabiei]MBE4786772.1 DUF4429 domain-containing protein [Streptomyces caniscabiei]MBE4794974.1 DUF4429 domain-containing protein [Streptomyces caniscabiei]